MRGANQLPLQNLPAPSFQGYFYLLMAKNDPPKMEQFLIEIRSNYLIFVQPANNERLAFIDLNLTFVKQVTAPPQFGIMPGFRFNNSEKKETIYSEQPATIAELERHLMRWCIFTRFSFEFVTERQIHRGFNSVLYLVRNVRSNERWVVKVFEKEPIMKSAEQHTLVENEILIMREFDHPNIVHLKQIFEGENNLYCVIEYFAGKQLLQEVQDFRVFSEQYALIIMKQVLIALEQMHQKGIMHRDIKLDNIMFKNNEEFSEVALVDLGFGCRFARCLEISPWCGSAGYTAPEILFNQPYTAKVDVYSAGVVLYMMLSGRAPFNAVTSEETIRLNKFSVPNYNF